MNAKLANPEEPGQAIVDSLKIKLANIMLQY